MIACGSAVVPVDVAAGVCTVVAAVGSVVALISGHVPQVAGQSRFILGLLSQNVRPSKAQDLSVSSHVAFTVEEAAVVTSCLVGRVSVVTVVVVVVLLVENVVAVLVLVVVDDSAKQSDVKLLGQLPSMPSNQPTQNLLVGSMQGPP